MAKEKALGDVAALDSFVGGGKTTPAATTKPKVPKRTKKAVAKKPRAKATPKINTEDAVKITLYIRQDQMFSLEDIRRERIQAGTSLGAVDKSKLMREALDMFIKKNKV